MRALGIATTVEGLLLPGIAAWAALEPRTRSQVAARLTWTLPEVEPGALWVHAASLGEGRAACALLSAVRALRPDLPLLRTATSTAGAGQDVGADASGCLPLDAGVLVRRFLRRVRPRALVLVEGDLWPALLLACRRRNLPVAVAGARVGQGTRRLVRRWPGLWREMVACVGTWTARSEEDAAFLEPTVGGEVPVCGDLKLEATPPRPALSWARPALVAGSTHPGEEGYLLDAASHLPAPPLVVLAPRRPDRFEEVATLLDARRVRWVRRTALPDGRVPPDVDVVLLDTLGELAGLYAGARAAFVGGTFDPEVGGHSAAEPLGAGVPVVHGPHVWATALEGRRTFPAPDPRDLCAALSSALGAPLAPLPTGGAVDRALRVLAPLLDAPVPGEAIHRPLGVPLVPLWLAAGASRRVLRRRRAGPVPVVSVGSLAAGGTGKTPVALWIAGRIGGRPNASVAVVSRGYRRAPRGNDVRVAGAVPDGRFLGDETALAARRGFLAISCPDRLAAVREAARLGARVAVIDDGFQQRDVEVDLDVVVIDGREPQAGGVIPAGTRREPLAAIRRAQVVWVHHGSFPQDWRHLLAPDALVVEARYQATALLGPEGETAVEALAGQPVAAFAGIARPAGFFRMLAATGARVERRRVFPDHHAWTAREIRDLVAWAGGRTLVATEKDLARGVRIPGLHALCIESVPIRGASEMNARVGALLSEAPRPG
ncbi:MAG: tetraacyldisaccharide 4'-kinase [Deltaproteobacteria bacterium]|nr:tetraacyldisaccharide 4'-kinase [Deltaproteobacteria bacterium]